MHGIFSLPNFSLFPSLACFMLVLYDIIFTIMADNDFDFSKITQARNKEEWQKAFDEFSEFVSGGSDKDGAQAASSSAPASSVSSVSPARPSVPKPKNIHAGHRERLRRSAANNDELLGFTDIEVLETLLSFFIPYKDTNPISHSLIDKFGTLAAVLRASPEELFAVGSMTKTAAEMLPLIADAPLFAHKFNVRLSTHRAAAEFFASVFIGGAKDGVYVAFLDKTYKLIAVERHALKSGGAVNIRAILGAISKHGAKSIIVARRERGITVSDEKAIRGMRIIKEALHYTDVKLLDCMIFLDYGYYSMMFSGADGDFIFLPIFGAVGSPALADALINDSRRADQTASTSSDNQDPSGGE